MQADKYEKFIKLMMLTTSDNDGECLVAIRKANALLAEANVNWEQLLKNKVTVKAGQVDSSNYQGKKYTNSVEIEAMLEALMLQVHSGSSFHEFVKSVYEWWEDKGFLTEKQYNAIRRSYERL